MIDKDLIEDIRKSADIVTVISQYLDVTKKGKSYLAICPFHADTTPSLNISKEKQLYKCFACGHGGNVFGFVQDYEHVSFPEAVRKVAEIANIHDPRLEEKTYQGPRVDPEIQKLYDCIDDLQKFYVLCLSTPEAELAHAYLKKRGIPEEMVAKYDVGYALTDGTKTVKYLQGKGHGLNEISNIGIVSLDRSSAEDHNAGRLIFPLHNAKGQVVGFSARKIRDSEESKYVNSNDNKIFHKSSILYNYHRVDSDPKTRQEGCVYVLEGFMDVIALDRAGIPNAVALMGTALTQEHVKMLKKLKCEVRLCLDGDDPGQAAMMKALPLLNKAEVPVRLVSYESDTRDPDEIITQDGPEALRKRLGVLLSPFDFQMAYYASGDKFKTDEGRQEAINRFIPYLLSLKEGIEREDALAKLAKATGYQASAIKSVMENKRLAKSEEERSFEVTSYDQAETIKPLLKENKSPLSRLMMGERKILAYMLTSKEAIGYYKRDVRMFHTEGFDEIAQFVIEYSNTHPEEQVDVPTVISSIESSGIQNAQKLGRELADIGMAEDLDPYSESNINYWISFIKEEKQGLKEKVIAQDALSSSDQEAQAKALEEMARSKNARLKGKKKDPPGR